MILMEIPAPAPVAVQIDQRREAGVARALELIRAGRPGEAQYVLMRSVRAQARLAAGLPVGRLS